jgi:lipid A 4'-phosphatase
MTAESGLAQREETTARAIGPAHIAWGVALLTTVPLTFVPALDLTAAGWFYDPVGHFFPVRQQAWAEWVRHGLPVWIMGGLAATVALWGIGRLLRRALIPLSGRAVLFLVLSLALGPGLTVNTILKDHWGRPRPSTVTQFGGVYDYRPPVIPGGPCPNNCSFPSGHASLGFWMAAPAMLAPKRRRRWTVPAAVGFGAAVGLVRMAQGGHFLSDVVFSGLITVGIITILYSALIARDGEA